MRGLILFLLVELAAGQTGQHRKIFTASGPPINCTAFAASGIVEKETAGTIFWSGTGLPITLTAPIAAGDPIFILGINNSGGTTVNPSIADGINTWHSTYLNNDGSTYSIGMWWTTSVAASGGDTITVNFNAVHNFNVNWDVSVVHISHTFAPSLATPLGNTGTFPTTPNFTINSSFVTYGASGTTGALWFLGGIGIPSTATYGYGLIIAGIGTSGSVSLPLTPPSPWTLIINSGFPSSQLAYSCSFP